MLSLQHKEPSRIETFLSFSLQICQRPKGDPQPRPTLCACSILFGCERVANPNVFASSKNLNCHSQLSSSHACQQLHRCARCRPCFQFDHVCHVPAHPSHAHFGKCFKVKMENFDNVLSVYCGVSRHAKPACVVRTVSGHPRQTVIHNTV